MNNEIQQDQDTLAKNDPRYLSSVERGFRVLDVLSDASVPMSLTEISQQTGLAVPTLQRLTAQLSEAGYLEKEPKTKRYSPTIKTVDILYSYLSRNQFAKRAWPYLVKLREELSLDVSLSVPIKTSMIYVHRLPGFRGNFENTLPGKKVPLYLSASGRCLLAMKPDSAVEEYLGNTSMQALTPWSQTDPALLMAEIVRCRALGYAIVKQEVSSGTVTLACPVTKRNEAIAGVSVHVPIVGLDQSTFLERVLPAMVAVSQALSSG